MRCICEPTTAMSCTLRNILQYYSTTTLLHCSSSPLRRLKRARSEDELEASATEFQVFLSFRGPDSRQGLADVLYDSMTSAGIRVFRDNDELEPGDEISKILPSIENSKICVPIFSESFASSVWCLREVERMVELKKKIMPIFYTATPDDVKLRTELFKQDLKEHEKKHGREQVKKWEDALKAVGKIIGREVKTTGFVEFSTSFVKALLIKLRERQKHVTDCIVKRHDLEEAMMRLLDTSAEDLRLVGIYGMGGTGKTTIAKVVFNQLLYQFDCYSFLENIQESLRRHDGLEYLQKKLMGDLNPKLKDFENIDPIGILRELFRRSKVLIVLDDVNERKQIKMIIGMLNWFGSGSRVIVTTRDRRVLTGEDWTMEVEEMDNNQALQLISRHAFGEDAPPIGYHSLSNEVISLTGNLPLAIEVIGSSLHQREEKIWRATIEKLKKVPNKDVKEKLKISFDALEKEEQQIFLDIACFFISKETFTAIYMWDACDYFPDVGINVLVSMSLVKITSEDKFWMHDLIRDLGRQLVRDECFSDPAKRSRIWTPKEADKVLRLKQGKENVEGLYQEWPSDRDLTHEHFSSFRNLRLLKVVGVKLAGDFEDLLLDLKWFSWHRCPSDFAAINLSLRELVVLDLSWSFISERWTGWSIIQIAKDLKILDLRGCGNLRSTPDFSSNTLLERLSFRDCRCLVELDSSIGKLKRLKHLDLIGCHSLIGLPEEIGLLEDLEELLVDGSGNTFSLPNSIGKLCSLSVIKFSRMDITRIPDTISGLVHLTRLYMCSCTGMTRLPEAIGDLISLERLDLTETGISMLPDSIGKLVKLEALYLSQTNMDSLPDSIGNLVQLETLELSGTNMVALPDSIGNLIKLEMLNLSKTKIDALPDSIGKLVELTRLHLSGTKINVLPNSTGNLVRLRSLMLEHTEMAMLPYWVGNFCELEQLWVGGSKIRSLPSTLWSLPMLSDLSCNYTEVPEGTEITCKLTELELTVSCAAEISPIVDQLPGLRELKIEFCKNSSTEKQMFHLSSQSTHEFLTNPMESSSDTLPLDFGAFIGLVKLVLDCSGLKGILRRFPSTLQYLILSYVTPETELPNLSNLMELEYIAFIHCFPRDSRVVVEGLRVLTRLMSMQIDDCTDELVEFSCHMESLWWLSIAAHPASSQTWLDFSRMKNLKHLYLRRFKELTQVRGLGALDTIIIEDCVSLQNIDELKRRR